MTGYKKEPVILIIGLIALLRLVGCGKKKANMATCLKKEDRQGTGCTPRTSPRMEKKE